MRILAGGTALALTMLAAPGMAQQAQSDATQSQGTRRFDIPAQSLTSAVTTFGDQAGLQVTVDGAILSGLRSQGVRGSFIPAEALARLLSGTGITFRWVDGRSVALEHAPQVTNGAIQLGTLRVEGAGGAGIGRAGIGEGESTDPFAIYSDPRAVFTVNRQKLDRMPQTTPSDLFNAIPGVQMANAGSSTSFDPNIRGMQGQGRVKVLIDGTDTTQATRVTYAGNRSHNFVDPDFVGGIEVEKGPGLESGGMGGTISLRTFNASDIITDPKRNWGIRARGMIGDNSGDMNSALACTRTRTITGTGAVTSALTDPTLTLLQRCQSGYVGTQLPWETVSYTDTYAFKPYVTDASVPSANYSGSIIGAWRPFENLDLLAGYARRQSGNYSAGKHGKIDHDYPTNGGYYFDFTPKDSFSYWQPGDEVYGTFTDTESVLAKALITLGDHNILFKYSYFDSHYVQHASADSQGTHSVVEFFPPTSHSKQQRYGAEYAWQPDSNWIRLKADIWGADTREMMFLGTYQTNLLNRVDTDSFGFGLNNTSLIPLFSGTLTLKIGGQYKKESIDSDTEVDGVEMKQYGLFVSANLPITDWITLDGGVRYDDYKATIDPNVYYRFASNNGDDATTLHGGITLQPAEPLQFFLRYAEGWRAPSGRENTLNNCGGGPEFYERNGQLYYRCLQGLMKPEQSKTFEFGTNLSLTDVLVGGDKLGVKITRFNNRIRDYIFGSGTSVLPVMNIPKAKFVGYEVSVSYDAGWVFADYGYTNNDKVAFCGTDPRYLDSCIGTNGWGDLNSLYIPARHRHDATLGLRLLDRKLTIGGTATLVRGTGWEWDGLDRYDVYDLFASYERGPVTFALSAENIGDRYYFPAGTGAAWPLPAAGRMVRGTLTFQY